MLDVCLLDAFA
ncbi:hypothetical protein I2709_003870 [Vibrio mimicus]|nr:hypothetical protein [Vibrio cholerae]HBK7239923.1 hypothetical protein [Vibrio cholerae]